MTQFKLQCPNCYSYDFQIIKDTDDSDKTIIRCSDCEQEKEI